jgi:hypothetical protein
MKPRTLVTHLHPHLDDVAGFWLLARFDPALKKARMKFVPTSAGGIRLAPREIGVGVGRGKYDEHKGDRKDSAASLIWKDLKRRRLLPGGLRGRAVQAMIEYVRRGDLGEFIGQPGNFYNLSSIFQTLAGLSGEDSASAAGIGLKVLDALVVLYGERLKVDDAARRGRKFATRWGRGVALTTDAIPASVSSAIAEKGYALVVLRHPSGAYLHVRATPTSRADLTALAKAVRAEEPDREWYLHHSKKLFLHGDLVAPTPKRTRHTLDSMTRLIKKLYGR